MLNEILYINPSHQKSNEGVEGYGTEAEQCYAMAVEVKKLLDASGQFKQVIVGGYDLTLSQSIAQSNSVGATMHLDIHTDAGGARGCTTFYVSENGKKLATAIYNHVSTLTQTEDRGIRYRTDLACLNQTDAIASLVEMFFHDSIEDVRYFYEHKQDFAVAISKGICEYFGVELVQPAQVVVEPVPVQVPQGSEFVRKLQQACNDSKIRDARGYALVVDGIPGQRTFEALSKIILKYGSTGIFVSLVQAELGGLVVDGQFGLRTKYAVIAFQKYHGLVPDSVIGINTWKKLCER